MKLEMGAETARYFDKHGFVNSKDLEQAFARSCQDQRQLRRRATGLRRWGRLPLLPQILTPKNPKILALLGTLPPKP